jgi:hypothetical protein
MWKKRAKKWVLTGLLLTFCLLPEAPALSAPVESEDVAKASEAANLVEATQREADFKARNDALDQREADLKDQSDRLAKREAALDATNEELTKREAALDARNEDLTKREAGLKASEDAIAERETKLDAQVGAQVQQDTETKARQEAEARRKKQQIAQAAALVNAGDSFAKNRNYAEALQRYEQAYRLFRSEEIEVRCDNARRALGESKK